jgi:hypothetical protein
LFAAGAPALAIWRTGKLGKRNLGVKMQAIMVCLIGLYACGVSAADEQGGAEREELQGIDDQVQTLKKEIIQINHELSLLEEKLLFPSTTQVSIFVSVMAQPEFRMDSLELSVDDQVVAKYIYTFRELEALHKGGCNGCTPRISRPASINWRWWCGVKPRAAMIFRSTITLP